MAFTYHQVGNKSFENPQNEELGLVTGSEKEGSSSSNNAGSKLYRSLWAISRIVFLITYVLLAIEVFRSHVLERSNSQLGNEAIYNDLILSHEKVVFQRAGFHDSQHRKLTPYEGEPNPQNNAAWDRLMSVGIAILSADENRRLKPSGTATLGNGRYVVELEMFHQLHCLKKLRRQLWEIDASKVNTSMNPKIASQRRQHLDHCIDYLRQVIMYHGDVTPNTFEWNSEVGSYLVHHKVDHQCRSFETIFSWAASRNNSGWVVDGDHENVVTPATVD